MSASAPLLAALLRAALPGIRALDLGAPALFPWLPGTLLGVAEVEALPPAEAALLRRFCHPDGRPLVGFDRAADAALLTGAPSAWGDAPERLLRVADAARLRGVSADMLFLVPTDAEGPAGLARARVLLLLGAGEAVERYDLLVPPARMDALHAALCRAAEALAEGAAGGRWLVRALAISDRMASLAFLPEEAQTHRPALSLPAAALLHDAPNLAGVGGLALPEHGRVRLLLGAPPAGPVRVFLRGEGASGAALFGDGRRLFATHVEQRSGETCLEAGPWPPSSAGIAVLGVAASAGAALIRLEFPT